MPLLSFSYSRFSVWFGHYGSSQCCVLPSYKAKTLLAIIKNNQIIIDALCNIYKLKLTSLKLLSYRSTNFIVFGNSSLPCTSSHSPYCSRHVAYLSPGSRRGIFCRCSRTCSVGHHSGWCAGFGSAGMALQGILCAAGCSLECLHFLLSDWRIGSCSC